MAKEFLTVSELNTLIQGTLQAGFPYPVWVCGEVQQYDLSKNKKHIYFQLVEKDARTNQVKASISLVIWQGKKAQIERILKESPNAFELKDDIEVKFACRVDFYPPYGKIQLIVESIDPTYTLGKLAQEKQRLIALLTEKGVLDKNKQVALPPVPLRIGLITSDDSAAYNDFISEFRRSGLGFRVFLRNTVMQGKNAEDDVCQALACLDCPEKIDAVVITRGGGSLADLRCFDSQKIAEKIAKMRVPVLSGIGHEINLSITDLAAHTYAKTPTAIAQFLVSRSENFLETLCQIQEQINELAGGYLDGQKQFIKESAQNLHQLTVRFLKTHREKMIQYQEFFKQRPLYVLKESKSGMDRTQKDFVRGIKTFLETRCSRLEGLEKMVSVLNPVNTLKRGFSITRNAEGKVIKSIKDVDLKETIQTQLHDGILANVVEKKVESRK